jgi:two-component system KDP operon response regulator KdpE
VPYVLVVEDDQGIFRLVKIELAAEGFEVAGAGTGEEAIASFEGRRPDLVVLDLGLPDMTGYDVMTAMRERAQVPIIFLTAKGADEEKVRGLSAGADDYLAKPFSPEELSARVKAILRRHASPADEHAVRFGDIEIDLNTRLVKRGGDVLSLTKTEWRLLELLAAKANHPISHFDLLSQVWGPEHTDQIQYLRVWISRLRKKLEPEPSAPEFIVITKHGYMLDTDGVSKRSETDDEEEFD